MFCGKVIHIISLVPRHSDFCNQKRVEINRRQIPRSSEFQNPRIQREFPRESAVQKGLNLLEFIVLYRRLRIRKLIFWEEIKRDCASIRPKSDDCRLLSGSKDFVAERRNRWRKRKIVCFDGARLSHAEIGEIMITNRSSPTRALKNVITALQSTNIRRRLSSDAEQRDDSNSPGVVCQESVQTVREFRRMYGLLKLKSGKKTG
ncbi:hypothetical protein RJ641_016609 [Dillenia turbinata]|uniref:Uncharacterized protein n=1 Tax=Dillenia turbinata TaxID=194707 RepID=A0AAN8UWN2_9MAGN